MAKTIGHGLETRKILRKWKKVKLLPTRPTLHASYDKSKFSQVLQIHNKTISDTTKIMIKNMWVGDYYLTHNEELCEALGIENRRYTFRQLVFATANSQKIEIKDFLVTGSRAYIVCDHSLFRESVKSASEK